jgi:acylphosphatase
MAHAAGGAGAAAPTACLSFEVRGKVQGVFFRKHTQAQAVRLGITGWVANDPADDDRVVGVVQGPAHAVSAMRDWLTHTGSPKCRIDSATFHDVAETEPRHGTFLIRR